MLFTNLMIRANDRTLKKRPHAFHAVRVTLAAHVFAKMMIDCLMACVLICYSLISRPRISHNTFGLISKRGLDELVKRATIIRLFDTETNAAAALNRSQDHCLANCAATLNHFLASALVHVLSFAADVRLINFYDTGKKRSVSISNGSADTMTEIPRGVIRYGQNAFALRLLEHSQSS